MHKMAKEIILNVNKINEVYNKQISRSVINILLTDFKIIKEKD